MFSTQNTLPDFLSQERVVFLKDTRATVSFDKLESYWPQIDMAEHPSQLHSRDDDNSLRDIRQRTSLPLAPGDANPTDELAIPDYASHIEQDRNGRPKRKRISPHQLESLLDLFQQTDTPSYEQRERVAARLGMSNREVQVSACIQWSL